MYIIELGEQVVEVLEQFQTVEPEILVAAGRILSGEDDALLSALDQLPAPLYVTDAEGVVRYFNPACIGFTGRTPAIGKDRWCVTWKLYTDADEPLPHELCPMADAIKRKRAVRGVSAVAERPDGTRVNFMPYPTPIFAADGAMTGAVNILIDITDQRQAMDLRGQANRCRRLADSCGDDSTRDTLSRMAEEYDAKAAGLKAAAK